MEAKLVVQCSRKGLYQLKPKVHYFDELGQNQSLELKSLEIKVEEVLLSDRVPTGTAELDSLLLGGIPEGYAIALTGPPSDKRSMLIKNFLEAGTKKEQATFHVTYEPAGLEKLLEKPSFYLFIVNPNPRTKVPDQPNIYKLRSKIDLNNLNIALAKAYRSLIPPREGPKRACLEIISDILLHYNADITRKWLAELITDLGQKDFTILAVIDPLMHPKDQLHAVLGLFEGEINLFESESELECKEFLRVRKLRNQDYIRNSICLTTQS
jgi:KaiC/GvpD/RAD55 family RecA-like ATPase